MIENDLNTTLNMLKLLSIAICLSLNILHTNAVKEEGTEKYTMTYENHNNLLNHIRNKRTIKEEIENTNEKQQKEDKMKENITECIGDPEFCNMTREDYIAMLNDYIYPQTYEWVLIGTHTAVFVIGLVGNILVCVAVYRNHTMRTVTNYFLVNLAVADFMVLLFCLPATVLWDVTETWFLGDVLCKILLYFQSVSVTVSVLTLTFISVDRWYAICFPLKFKSTINRAKTAIFVIWAVSLVFNAPELVVLTTVKMVPLRFGLEYLVQCTATWSSTSDLVWHIIKVVIIYTIPLLLMTVAYHQIVRVLWSSKKIPGQAETIKLASAEQTQLRSRRKAAKMLVAVVVMFAVCYFPVHLLSMLRYILDMQQTDVITFLALISHVLCYANSAINPLIYNFMSGKYRREFRRAFCCSTSLTHERLTTMSRLTTSRKKYEQNFEIGHKCQGTLNQNNRFGKNDYGRSSLKVQSFDKICHSCDRMVDMPLKNYTYSQRGNKCDCSNNFGHSMNRKCGINSRDRDNQGYNKQNTLKCLCNGSCRS